MDNTFTFILISLILGLVAEGIKKRALKQLSTEEKSRVLDPSASHGLYYTFHGLYYTFVILGLIIMYIAATNFFPQSYFTLTLIFIVLVLAVWTTIAVSSYKKLKAFNIPEGYVNSFLVKVAIQFVAVIILLLLMSWQALQFLN